ncbi:MAG: hypothetical protein ACO1N1_04920 [Dyadobacter fermentans]
MARHFSLLIFSMAALTSCDGCRKNEFEVFNRVFPRCDVCTAVRMVNRKTKVVTTFDAQNVQTLRNVGDTLVIKRNGVVVVTLPNFKQNRADRKRRSYFFQSVSGSGAKSIRFVLTTSAETPLMTSRLMDGEYDPVTDTVDIYYRNY